MISVTLFVFNFLLLTLVGAFPVYQKLINEANHLVVAPALGLHPKPQESEFQTDLLQDFTPSNFRRHWRRHHKKRVQSMQEALIYLRRFGYLSDSDPLTRERVEEALKAFQEIVSLDHTGKLDKKTLMGMRSPRCGNSDISEIDDEENDQEEGRQKRFAQVSKWANKLDQNDVLSLKWHVQKYTKDIPRDEIRRVVRKAFKVWSDQIGIPSMRTVQLNFSEAQNPDDADINILWAKGNHGDDFYFDDAGDKFNILAHTFYPNYQETGSLNGDIHFDDFEKWVLDNSSSDGVHFPYVLVHEIGHALGLGHSKRKEAVMNPIYKKYSLENIVLDLDDKCAINWNYVGPTQTCLFVWLMVELLPIAKESNHTTHGIASGNVINITNAAPIQDYWNHQTLEERLNYTLETLQEADIPQCTDRNDVQTQYEALLQRALAFPRNTAQRYGPVVCNFLDGLSRVVHRSSDQVSRSNSVQHLTVHQYSQSTDRPDFFTLESSVLDESQDSSSSKEAERTRRRRSQRADEVGIQIQNQKRFIRNAIQMEPDKHILTQRDSQNKPLSVFYPEYFDDRFYQKLLTLFVQQSR